MTARERMSKAYDKCAHPIGGVAGHICVDCVTTAILAHAQAVREEAAQTAYGFWVTGGSGRFHYEDIRNAIRALKVS